LPFAAVDEGENAGYKTRRYKGDRSCCPLRGVS
jgi:hypothetical protein